MINSVKENSPRPAATGRSEDTKYQLNYNTIPTESKALISILGQSKIIEMFYKDFTETPLDEMPLSENLEAAENAFYAFLNKAEERVFEKGLYIDIECELGKYRAIFEKNAYHAGFLSALKFIFGGGAIEN